uniref:Uncharacterized protein n=1 Tax=Pundamilia nyererei TaxID=303518 RepID=A0A3B4GVV6_9CICH
MLPIQPGEQRKVLVYEELGTICVGPCIGHGQCPHACVLQLKVLIRKFLSIDGLAPCSIVVGKVSTLKRKNEAHVVNIHKYIQVKANLCVFAVHSHSPLPRCLLSHSLTERTDARST